MGKILLVFLEKDFVFYQPHNSIKQGMNHFETRPEDFIRKYPNFLHKIP